METLTRINEAAQTQQANIFNTYSKLWTGLFSQRGEATDLSGFLSSKQSSGIAGQSKAPKLFCEFYSTLIDERLSSRHPMSLVGGPDTFTFKGHDASVTYLENLAVFGVLLDMAAPARTLEIVEVGAGYGCMAYFLMQTGMVKSYTIIDLAENLINSAYFLSQNFPDVPVSICDPKDEGFNLVLPGHINKILGDFDLAINTDSLGEMRSETAKAYVAWIHDHLREGGLFFSKNGHRRGVDSVQRVSEYGYERFALRALRPPIAASSVFDDFGHLAVLAKGGAMTPDQVRDLDTLSDLYALGLHADLFVLSARVASIELDAEDRKFLDWAERFLAGGSGGYEGPYRSCASFMEGVKQAVNGRPCEKLVMAYLPNGQSWAAEVYANLLLSKGPVIDPRFTFTNDGYFMQEVKSIDRLPTGLRWLAYQVRVDNLRKKVNRQWKPAVLTRLKNFAFNLREGRLSLER